MQTSSTSANQPQKTIRIGQVLKEAWVRVNGLKWSVLKRIILNAVLVTPLWLIYVFYLFSRPTRVFASYVMVLMLMGVIQWINIKIWTPIYLMGVRKAIAMPISMDSIKTECARAGEALSNFVILYVLSTDVLELLQFVIYSQDTTGFLLGMMLKLVTDITVIFLGVFVLPLIVIRRLSLMQALDKASAKVLIYWKEVLGAYAILLVLPLLYRYINFHFVIKAAAVASVKSGLFVAINLLFFVATFWLAPLYFTIGGVLFRDVYGLKSAK